VKQNIWTATFTAVAGFTAAAALAAQATAQPPQPQTPSPAQGSDTKVTVTGCLRAAPPNSTDAPGAAGTAGTAGTTGVPGTPAATDTAQQKFVLMEASQTPDGPKQTYQLIANAAALGPHLGKKIELTGTIEKAAQDPKPATDQPTLRVATGRIVADSCDAK